jgi:hypothetical protein
MRLLLTAALLCLTLNAQAQDCSVKPDYTPWIPTVTCSHCTDQHIPQWQLEEWANEARAEIKRAVDERRLINLGEEPCWTATIVVLPTRCDFWIRGAYWFNHATQRYEHGDTCAVGLTEFRGYRVIVSLATGTPAQVRGVVRTETWNVYLQWMRRYDFIDRWTPKTIDPYAEYARLRRRTVRLR